MDGLSENNIIQIVIVLVIVVVALIVSGIWLWTYLESKIKEKRAGKELRNCTIVVDDVLDPFIWAYDELEREREHYKYNCNNRFPSLNRGDRLRALINGNDEIIECTKMDNVLETETKEFNLLDIQPYKNHNEYILESSDGIRMKLGYLGEPCMVGDKLSITKAYLRGIPDSDRLTIGSNYKRW